MSDRHFTADELDSFEWTAPLNDDLLGLEDGLDEDEVKPLPRTAPDLLHDEDDVMGNETIAPEKAA